MVYRNKLAGKKRPRLPKLPTGFTETSTIREDGNDAVVTYGLDRGIDPTYALPMDAINADLRSVNDQPFIRLVGDSFVSNTESQINLLAVAPWPVPTTFDLTALVGTGPLTNNNGVTMVQETSDDESPLYEYYVPSFASASSQYLSVGTASAVQVGTNSFTASIFFKCAPNSSGALFSYGSNQAGKAYWLMNFNSGGVLQFEVWDGTTTNHVIDTIANRWCDNRWHCVTAIVDNTSKIIYLVVDGVLIGTVAITYSSSLTVSGSNFLIGSWVNSGGANTLFFNGQLANFKLINNATDYNVHSVWRLGTREAVSSGTFTAPTSDSNKRLNNKFGTPNTNGAYFYTTIWTEDGDYDIQVQYEKGSSNGMLDIVIDDNTVILQLDTYNGSTTHNNSSSYGGNKLSAGAHTIKILNDSKNASSFGYTVNLQWINFIKRGGHEQGGLTRALLLGDEIIQRQNNQSNFSFVGSATSDYYCNEVHQISTVQGDYTEGSLFIKGGLYRVDWIYDTTPSSGKFDIWFGNVQVIAALDHYSSSTIFNVVKSVYVRLQHGKQDIRVLNVGQNGGSTGFGYYWNTLRLERLSD